MSEVKTPITGCARYGVYPRLSIESLQAEHPKQFTLFILSFLLIQNRDLDLTFSSDESNAYRSGFYRVSQANIAEGAICGIGLQFKEIAGIHGLPYKQWAGDQTRKEAHDRRYDKEDPKDTEPYPSRFGGYCNHGSVLFPTWHRPYVLAIEQAISAIAISIAENIHSEFRQIKDTNNAKPTQSEMDELQEWEDAAKTLRFPFWDWAEERVLKQGLPPVLSSAKVSLKFGKLTLSGKKVSGNASNPLAYYQFKEIPDGFRTETLGDDDNVKAYFADWQRTYRHAEGVKNPEDSNTNELNGWLHARAASIRARVALLFSWDDFDTTLDPGKGAEIWNDFSNHTGARSLLKSGRDKPDSTYYESIEGIHDSIHIILGGNGHMSDPDYAGFDPIFYLHHCNVDRLLALWEYLYPDYFIGSPDTAAYVQGHGTYSLVYNARVDATTPLAPFRVADGSYWNSNQTRFLTDRMKDPNTQTYPKYYTYPEIAGIKVDDPVPSAKQRPELRARLQEYYGYQPAPRWTGRKGEAPIFKRPRGYPGNTDGYDIIPGYRAFIIVILISEFAFNKSYSVDVYYQCTSGEEPIFVGAISAFVRREESACASCIERRAGTSTIRGVVPIPWEIIDRILERFLQRGGDISTLDLAEELKRCLRAEIVGQRGEKLAHVVHGQPYDAGHRNALQEYAVPEIRLVSSAALSTGDGRRPPKSVDWTDHGHVFESARAGWHRAS